eukprot:TRINITY_DN512_c0_g1_i3.p1 TRINITY_DN512_c0_g1~~TRINITY_DN512_c0_g1_i3.p1  ORF type:complete len:111 (+),score=11.39 TRINITY_DN512_c0_g1_i3:143-475(+)
MTHCVTPRTSLVSAMSNQTTPREREGQGPPPRGVGGRKATQRQSIEPPSPYAHAEKPIDTARSYDGVPAPQAVPATSHATSITSAMASREERPDSPIVNSDPASRGRVSG